MNFILFLLLNGLFIATLVTGRMTQVRYTRDQLIDLRTCGDRSLHSDVIARINTLMVSKRRGCRAGRQVKLKLQRRALGVRYSDRNDIDDDADGNHQRLIPTIITDNNAVIVNNRHADRCRPRDRRTVAYQPQCLLRVPTQHSVNNVNNAKLPTRPGPSFPSLYVLNAAALTKPHAIEHLAADFLSY